LEKAAMRGKTDEKEEINGWYDLMDLFPLRLALATEAI